MYQAAEEDVLTITVRKPRTLSALSSPPKKCSSINTSTSSTPADYSCYSCTQDNYRNCRALQGHDSSVSQAYFSANSAETD